MYFNEIEPFAAEWLGNLFPESTIDTRSIKDVTSDDVIRHGRVHFFGGIGGWEYALQLSGWPIDRPVWTGSCPCQPFSSAGKQKGQADERHFWPEMFRLIRECRPEVVFGEQVASSEVVGTELEAAFLIAVQTGDFARANKIAKRLVTSSNFHFDKRWLAGIRSDLEGEGYSVRWMVLGAHSVQSPHIRQRLYWVAESSPRRRREESANARRGSEGSREEVFDERSGCCGSDGRLGVSDSNRCEPGKSPSERVGYGDSVESASGVDGGQSVRKCGGGSGGMGDTSQPRLQGYRRPGEQQIQKVRQGEDGYGSSAGFWSDYSIVHCTDGKARRVGRKIQPLVNGIPRDMGRGQSELGKLVRGARANRVGRLKGYGNAIVPQAAAEFIRAFLETENEQPSA